MFLQNLEFYAYHGVPAEERKIGHRYSADLVLIVKGTADKTDNVADTVDYGAVAKFLEEKAKSLQVQTLERLARLLAEGLLKEFQRVQKVTISLSKPMPPMPAIAEAAGVTLEIGR